MKEKRRRLYEGTLAVLQDCYDDENGLPTPRTKKEAKARDDLIDLCCVIASEYNSEERTT